MTIDALTILPFGKYKDELAGDVADEDPEYICWLHDKTNHKIDEWLLGVCVKAAAREMMQ